MEQKWKLIINPAAGNGKGKRLSKAVEDSFIDKGIPFESAYSNAKGHLIELASEAYSTGFRKFAMLGGDGTANEIVNGIARSAGMDQFSPDSSKLPGSKSVPHLGVTLSMIGIGTGNDWMKTLQLPKSHLEAADLIAQGKTRAHDLGRVCFPDGSVRYFLNIAGLGFDGEVTNNVAGRGGVLAGSKLSYWLAILQAIFTYKHTRIRITIDGQSEERETLSGAIGICKFNGGGMMQLPEAEFDDGLLDVTFVGEMSKLSMIRHLPNMLDGSFTKLKAVHTYRGKKIEVQSQPSVWVEADGEVLGRTPAQIDQFHKVFDVVVPTVA